MYRQLLEPRLRPGFFVIGEFVVALACATDCPRLIWGARMSDVGENAATAPVVVFVIEDEALIRELIVPAIQEAGFGVLVASTGTEALKVLDTEAGAKIRALVTDIHLGPSSPTGWEVAKRARQLHPEIPVVYMTGANAAEWSSEGVPNSVLITKPFAPAQIVTAISQLLNEGSSTAAG